MLNFIWPVILVVLANVLYNIAAKAIPPDCSPYLALVVAYGLAAALSLGCHFIFESHTPLTSMFSKINWATYLLALSMVGLEVGYIFMYRVGWKISMASLVSNILLALALLLVGILFYREKIAARQLVGIAVCLAGICILSGGNE